MKYLEFFYDDEGNLVAEECRDYKYRYITNKKNVKKLLDICIDYGYNIHGPITIRNYPDSMMRDFNRYMRKKKQPLKIYGQVDKSMKVNRKASVLRKKATAIGLAIALTAGGVTAVKSTTKDAPPVTIAQTQTDNTTKDKTTTSKTTTHEENTTNKETEKHVHKHNKIKKESKKELNSMLDNEEFHFSYENRAGNISINNAERYEDVFEENANKYGLDKDLLMAIAAQESSGDHYNNLDGGPASGIMQIEKAVHIGETISAHNFETGGTDSITITADNLRDINTNIKVGSMILRQCMENRNFNIPLALQEYNFGPGNVNKVLNACSEGEGIDINTLINNPSSNEWLNYRSFLQLGDPEYVEHVFSYLNKDSTLSVKDQNNKNISIDIKNDIEKSKQM